MDRTIHIFYIATGRYTEYFKYMIETIGNFFPDNDKHIHFLIDQTKEEWANGFYAPHVFVEFTEILDMPYPLVPLIKTVYLKKYMRASMRYIFYIDADTYFKPMAPEIQGEVLQMIDNGNILISDHPVPDAYMSCNSVPYSISHIDGDTTDHLMSSFFAGNYDSMQHLCDKMNEYIRIDLNMMVDGSTQHVIPRYFDEEYLNKVYDDSKKDTNTPFGEIKFKKLPFIELIEWKLPNHSPYKMLGQKFNIEPKQAKRWASMVVNTDQNNG